MNYLNEIDYLKNQINIIENEKEKLFIRLNECQKENLDLKNRLIDIQTSRSPSQTHESQEIEKLKRIIEELVKSNEEKDKKCDELTKQVIRFKRIQEIVLSAQTSVNASSFKTKNLVDLADIDINSESNLISNKCLLNEDTLRKPNSSTMPSNNINKLNDGKQSSLPASVNQLMLPNSLSSSLSSLSSNSSSSSPSSSINIVNNHKNQNNIASSLNQNVLVAPLASISEIVNLNTPIKQNESHLYQSSETLLNETTEQQLVIKDKNVCTTGSNSTLCNTSVEKFSTITITNNTIINNNLNVFKPNKKQQKEIDFLKLNSKYSSSSLIDGRPKQNASLSLTSQFKKNTSSTLLPTTNSGSSNTNSSASSNGSANSKGIRNFFGKLIRTSLVNISESSFNLNKSTASGNTSCSPQHKKISTDEMMLRHSPLLSSSTKFKRGGTRATANARLQNNFSISNNSLSTAKTNVNVSSVFIDPNLDAATFTQWDQVKVCEWLQQTGFHMYIQSNPDGSFSNKWIKNGSQLLQASQYDYEKELGIKNPLHRKKLFIILQAINNKNVNGNNNENSIIAENTNMYRLDQQWVTRWLDDIGLPQYKDIFHECMIDGIMLHHLSNDDFQTLNIHSELHYLSIKRAIHVLRLNNFDPQCLRRRPSGDELLDKSEVMLWTNHRVMEWLRSIDLSEYAPNLRGSGVHGGLMVFEARFNSTVLADILSIPTSKTLIRRHLNSLFVDLIGPQMQKLKQDTENQSGYQQLSASSKVKHTKRSIVSGGLFSHKRTKSQDFFNSPISILNTNTNEKQITKTDKNDENKSNRATKGSDDTQPLVDNNKNNEF